MAAFRMQTDVLLKCQKLKVMNIQLYLSLRELYLLQI